jgi:hypothetical protein
MDPLITTGRFFQEPGIVREYIFPIISWFNAKNSEIENSQIITQRQMALSEDLTEKGEQRLRDLRGAAVCS